MTHDTLLKCMLSAFAAWVAFARSDANLWMVKCAVGQEQEVAVQLMRRFFQRQHTDSPLLIKSVVAYPQARVTQNRSYIYVEAYKEAHVKEARPLPLPLARSELQQQPATILLHHLSIHAHSWHITHHAARVSVRCL